MLDIILLTAALAAQPAEAPPPEPDPNMLVSWTYEERLEVTPKAVFSVLRADGTATYESGKTESFSGKPPVELPGGPVAVSFERLEVLWHGWQTEDDFEMGRRRESDGFEIVKAVDDGPEVAESTTTNWEVSAEARSRAERAAAVLRDDRMRFAAIRERQMAERRAANAERGAREPRRPDVVVAPGSHQINVRVTRGGRTVEDVIAGRD